MNIYILKNNIYKFEKELKKSLYQNQEETKNKRGILEIVKELFLA
jgi:hypothetical protein